MFSAQQAPSCEPAGCDYDLKGALCSMALHCLEAGLVPPEISPGAAHSMLRVCRALDAVHALARGSIRRLRAGRFLAALTLVVPFVCVSAASTLSPCHPRSARRLASPPVRTRCKPFAAHCKMMRAPLRSELLLIHAFVAVLATGG